MYQNQEPLDGIDNSCKTYAAESTMADANSRCNI